MRVRDSIKNPLGYQPLSQDQREKCGQTLEPRDLAVHPDEWPHWEAGHGHVGMERLSIEGKVVFKKRKIANSAITICHF